MCMKTDILNYPINLTFSTSYEDEDVMILLKTDLVKTKPAFTLKTSGVCTGTKHVFRLFKWTFDIRRRLRRVWNLWRVSLLDSPDN